MDTLLNSISQSVTSGILAAFGALQGQQGAQGVGVATGQQAPQGLQSPWQQSFPTQNPLTQPVAQGASLMPTHINSQAALPLGNYPGVPLRMIQQIQRGECINFDSLYSALVYGSTARPGYSLLMDNHPELDLPVLSFERKGSDKGKISNLAAWLRTWNAYLSIFTQFRPHMLPDMLAYQDVITEYANTHAPRFWLAYDRAFRQYMANNPAASWGTENRRLYNSFLRNAPVLSSVNLPVSTASDMNTNTNSGGNSGQARPPYRRGACFNCREFGHKIKECPYARQGRGSGSSSSSGQGSTATQGSQSSTAPAPTANTVTPPFRAPPRNGQSSGVCYPWNAGDSCPPGCQRDHRCSFCRRLHPRYACKDPALTQDQSQQ